MKLLIADDEPKIRRGLLHILKKADLDLDILEPVKNGDLALKSMEQNRPDILLADICMPKVNGLELIKRAKEINPYIVVIIISGHDEFSYAKEAITLGVHDYLLKPIEEETLVNAINGILEDAATKRSKEKYLGMTSRFFSDWSQGFLQGLPLEETLLELKIRLSSSMYIQLIKIFPNYGLEKEEWDMDTLLFAISNIATEVYEDKEIPTYVFTDSQNHLIIFCDHQDKILDETLTRKIVQCVKEYLHQTIAIVTSLVENPKENLASAYNGLLDKLSKVDNCSKTVLEAKHYMDQHFYEDDLSLQVVASELNITPSYLSRLMKQELGISFIDYLTKLRLKKALQILDLRDKDIKIYEIAARVGYTSQHYFCKVFKKAYGVSPTVYKRSQCS